jgi:hypothetical protein
MPAKAGIQTWAHVPRLWIPAFRGNDTTSKDHILNDAPNGVLAGLHMPAVLGETTKTMDRSGVFHSGTG